MGTQSDGDHLRDEPVDIIQLGPARKSATDCNAFFPGKFDAARRSLRLFPGFMGGCDRVACLMLIAVNAAQVTP